MRFLSYIAFCLMILLFVAGCQSESDPPLPTRMVLSSPTLDSPTTPSNTPIPEPSATFSLTPSQAPTTPEPTATIANTPLPSPTAIVIPSLTPTSMAASLPDLFSFGRSVQGRELIAHRIGQGPQIIMLVGGIHGGWESNTVELMQQMITHFEITPDDLLPGATLIIVPLLNPDGAEQGRTLAGRFNANRVDLNRNWGCGWEPNAFFRDQAVSPGAGPFSEPETLALAALINDLRPAVVLSYHSAANGIFAGECEGSSVSGDMVRVYGEASGYTYDEEFTDYVVTGTAPGWISSLGIPSADVELAAANATELDRNLRGVIAVQCWVTGGCAP